MTQNSGPLRSWVAPRAFPRKVSESSAIRGSDSIIDLQGDPMCFSAVCSPENLRNEQVIRCCVFDWYDIFRLYDRSDMQFVLIKCADTEVLICSCIGESENFLPTRAWPGCPMSRTRRFCTRNHPTYRISDKWRLLKFKREHTYMTKLIMEATNEINLTSEELNSFNVYMKRIGFKPNFWVISLCPVNKVLPGGYPRCVCHLGHHAIDRG